MILTNPQTKEVRRKFYVTEKWENMWKPEEVKHLDSIIHIFKRKNSWDLLSISHLSKLEK